MIRVANRLTTGWKITGTKSFRLASAKLLGYYGSNMQNPSPSLAQCIIPDDGHVFLQPDQAGAEALIVAYEAPDGKFRQLFKLGIKVHSYMALQLFPHLFRNNHDTARYKFVDPATLANYPEWPQVAKAIKNSGKPYDLGKRVIHAKNYDMGFRTFQVNCLEMSEGKIVLSAKEAKEFLALHEQLFPEIQMLLADIRGRLAATRTLRNLFGYPRYFGGLWDDSLLRDAYSWVPQSTVGTITNLAYVDTRNYIKAHKLPWTLLNNKHDSLLMSVPDNAEHIEHGIVVLKRHMERPLISTKGEEYQMKSGMSIGHNWNKFDPETNPQGMKEL